MLEFLIGVQGSIQGSLATSLSSFAATRDWALLAAMFPMGVAFGAVHALTPGHGKTVLASYLVGSRIAGLKGLAVAGILALTHVGSAVAIALLALPLISRSLGGVGRAPSLEFVSRSLLVVIGAWLLTRALRGQAHHERGERNGVVVGVVAGLVPCPLTLFAMILALTRGVPEAGLTFALAMMVGVGLTLGSVALLTMIARGFVLRVSARYGASVAGLSRVLEGVAGALLIASGLHALFGSSAPFTSR